MDLKVVGQRIKDAREAKNLTQEELAALVNLSSTHVSVIERGLKVTKLDTFVAIANALDVSADELLVDVVAHSVTGVSNRLSDKISSLPMKEQKKIIKVIQALIEE
ncbi:helix-turn-helix domain-containing protein [Blautia sp.]|uniref:helix-turn-helix domain-containing protein n=1 Tax=Blautia sp. TaxID=1955243 RepID=UPI002588DD19|nr:helix-turn-helix transcriptional regulator [Blautia sp.]